MSIEALKSFQCTNHPDREGIGICMAGCRRVFCEECSTKIEGINTCLGCLKSKVKPVSAGPSALTSVANAIFGLGAVALGSAAMVGILYAFGMQVPTVNGEGATNRVFRNNEIVMAFARAFREYQTEVQEFPTEDLGFEALEWDEDVLGKRPVNHRGSYWPVLYDFDIETEDGAPLDAYKEKLRYIIDPRLPTPILISNGPDGVFETDIDKLAQDYAASKGKLPLVGDGDDLVIPVQ